MENFDFFKQGFEQAEKREGIVQKEVRRGDVFWCHAIEFDADGNPFIGKTRPVVVVSNEKANQFSYYITVVPITSQVKKPMPTHVDIRVNTISGTAVCETIFNTNKQQLGAFCGELDEKTKAEIDKALRIQLGLSEERKEAKSSSSPQEDLKNIPEQFIVPAPEIRIAKLEQERDVYKELYMQLLNRNIAGGGVKRAVGRNHSSSVGWQERRRLQSNALRRPRRLVG